MKSFLIHIIRPINIAAIVVDETFHDAMSQLTKMLSLTGKQLKFQCKQMKWVKTELFYKPQIVFYK